MKEIDDSVRSACAMLSLSILSESILGSIYAPVEGKNATLGQIIVELGTKIKENNFTLEDFAETRKKLAAFNLASLNQLEC